MLRYTSGGAKNATDCVVPSCLSLMAAIDVLTECLKDSFCVDTMIEKLTLNGLILSLS